MRMPHTDMHACWVGVDTSNYTTSVSLAVPDSDVPGRLRVVSNRKTPLPVAPGARGLRQSDALFAHTKNLPELMRLLRSDMSAGGLIPAAVGVSTRPRDAADSYMPCFLAGVAAAEAFAAGADVPLYRFSHQSGHIMAALYSSGSLFRGRAAGEPLSGEFLAFHVSGGTTEAVLAHPVPGGFSVEIVGHGADLHAGQVIDRVGVLLGLPFPCGPALEALALTCAVPLPPVRPSVRGGVCNLSGFENQAAKLWAETSNAPLVAAWVLTAVGKTLRMMTDQIQNALSGDRPNPLPVLYAGGVMSNRYIRPLLTDGAPWECLFSEPAFSADNAAGIALLCAEAAQTAKNIQTAQA
jgi:N6-L-threonylcarbamoyladenine synthase